VEVGPKTRVPEGFAARVAAAFTVAADGSPVEKLPFVVETL
jgi:hypothetical protein